MKYAKVQRCENGTIKDRRGEWISSSWRFGFCDKCDVVTWPFALRWLDPGEWRWQFRRTLGDLRYWYTRRKDETDG
jgi:hypothetical protein